MDTNTAQPRTTREAEAMGLRYTDWEAAWYVWNAKGERVDKRQSYSSQLRFERGMERVATRDDFGGWMGTRYPGNS